MSSQNPIITISPAQATDNSVYYLNNNISVYSNPDYITASENPIVYTLNSSAITSSNVFAQIVFDINSLPADDSIILLSASTNVNDFPSYQLQAKAEPKANQFYSTNTPGKTTGEVADSIVFGFNEDFSFRQRFYASRNSNQVIIQALKEGAKYNLDFYTDDAGITLTSTTDSIDEVRGQTLKDYAIWTDVFTNSAGDFGQILNRSGSTRIASFENTYSPDNIYSIDVSGVVKNFVETSLPVLSNTTFYRDSSAMNNFYLVFGEKYDEFRNNYRRKFLQGQTQVGWTLNSSLDLLSYNSLSSYTVTNSVITNSVSQVVKFLTNQPDEKEVMYSSEEILSFLYYNNTFSGQSNVRFRIDVDVYYQDGNTDTLSDLFITTINSGGCYSVNVSPSKIGIQTQESINSNKVSKYTCNLFSICDLSGSDVEHLICSQDYIINPDCNADFQKQFIWVNSLGRWDSFLFNGEEEISSDRKISTFNSSVGYIPTKTDSQINVYNIDTNKNIRSYSGWINKAHFEWLFEMQKSTDVRLYEDGLFKAIVIDKMEYKANTTDDLFNVSVDYYFSREENIIKK